MKMSVVKKKSLILTFALALVSTVVWAKIPHELESRFQQAVNLANNGDVEKSEQLYRELISKYPKVPELYNNLAVLMVKQGHQDKAIKVLEQGLRSQDSYASIYNNLVSINLSQSARNYMKALVPVGDDKPKLSSNPQLSEIADIYYGKADDKLLAMEETLKQTKQALEQAKADEARAQKQAQQATAARDKADEALKQAQAKAQSAAAKAKQALAQAAAAKASVEKQASAEQSESKPQSKADDVPPVMNLEDQVYAAVMAWADAWSNQNVQAYIDSYVDNYSPDNLSHRAWIKQRKVRLTRPAWIKLTLTDFEYFILDSDHVAVHFKQTYARKNYSDKGQKELVMVRQGADWKIEKESSY